MNFVQIRFHFFLFSALFVMSTSLSQLALLRSHPDPAMDTFATYHTLPTPLRKVHWLRRP